MSRKLAEEVLFLEMSDNTSEHLDKIPHLKEWVIDAMIEYHEEKLKAIGKFCSMSGVGVCPYEKPSGECTMEDPCTNHVKKDSYLRFKAMGTTYEVEINKLQIKIR